MHFSLYTVTEGANQKLSLPIGTIFCNGQWAVGGRLQGKGERGRGRAGVGNQVSNSLSIQIARPESQRRWQC